jgi:hypothetical protein
MREKGLVRNTFNKYNKNTKIKEKTVDLRSVVEEAEPMGDADFLFARPSFTRGMAAALDMGATLSVFNESKTPEEADARALRSDWIAVGKDILNAMKCYEQKNSIK